MLCKRGVENHVLDGSSLLVDRRAKHLKTDILDVKRLLRALMGKTQGDAQACRVVSAPTVEQEDARRVSRERERLVRERTGHINRIRALLTAQGIREKSVVGGNGWNGSMRCVPETGDRYPADCERRLNGNGIVWRW